MKKHLFILLTTLCMAFGVRAQEITIGDGTSVVSSMAFLQTTWTRGANVLFSPPN